MDRPGDVLRGLLAERELVRAPEALTPLMAVAVQQAGFEAMYLGGGSSAALHHALPDIGLVAPIELQPLAASLTAAAGIPLIVDLDHGADTTLGVGRVVRCFEDVGVAAIHLEDTSGNKKVKGLASLVSVDAFRANIASAVSACRQGMMVIARSDAWMTGGNLDEVVERGRAAAAEGAEGFFAPFTPRKYWRDVAEAVPVPIVDINPVDEEDRARMRLVLFNGVLSRSIGVLAAQVAKTLAETGFYPPITDAARTVLSELIGESGFLVRIPGATEFIDGRDTFGN